MAEDEEGTLALIITLSGEVIEPDVKKHHGRVFKPSRVYWLSLRVLWRPKNSLTLKVFRRLADAHAPALHAMQTSGLSSLRLGGRSAGGKRSPALSVGLTTFAICWFLRLTGSRS